MLIKPLRDGSWASRIPRKSTDRIEEEKPHRLTRNNFMRGKKRMTVEINRWNSHPYFFINGDLDFRVIKALEYEMSYFIEGYERSKKFKEGRWNGQECLLYKSKKGTYFFPAGLIDTVKHVLSDFEVDYIVQDIRLADVRKKYKPLDLTWTGPELRDYQKRAVIDIMNNEGGTVCLPTGSGKTLVALRIAYEYNLPFLVLVHTKELLYQWEKNIKTYFNGRCPGLVGDGYYNIEPITVAMMQTLSQKIVSEKIENLNFPVLFEDECHRAPCDTMYMVGMRCNAPVRCGLSVSGDTVVTIRNNNLVSRMPIRELCDKWENGERGFDTVSVDSVGKVTWSRVNNVWKLPHADRLYRIRGGYNADITITRGHSIMVYDAESSSIVAKKPAELKRTDYLIKMRSGRCDLNWLLDNDVLFVPVKSVEECNAEEFVYDISTENETFLGGNVFCHNSATPTRTDGAQLKIWATCGDIKCKITPDELIKSGVLAKPKFEFLTPSGMYIPRGTKYFDAYLSGIVLNESRNNLIVKKAMEYAAHKHTVYIHVERIDHGELLQSRIPGSVFLSGRDGATKRQGVLRKFSKGEIPVLISTLLKEGVDIPTISVFIAAGARKSEIAVIQKAGRALRVAPGKTEAIIVDFRDSGRYLADHWAERYNTYKSVFGDYVPDV